MPIDRTKITFWLDDICSEDIGIRAIDFPTFSGAEKRITKYTIPGRNGDLTYWDGSFGNVSCEISCYIISADKIDEALTAVNSWLTGSGYKKFVISSEPGRYRMAQITNAADIAVTMGVLAPFTIKLDCKPQRYFDEQNIISLPSVGGTVYNPTPFTSQPVIRCFLKSEPSGLVETISINGNNVTLRAVLSVKGSKYLDIDFESKTVTNDLESEVPVSAEFSSSGLVPGDNTISSTNLWFSSLYIAPRWWTL